MSAPPKTEGELYDRMRALTEECQMLAEVVDDRTASFLTAAIAQLWGARRAWLEAE